MRYREGDRVTVSANYPGRERHGFAGKVTAIHGERSSWPIEVELDNEVTKLMFDEAELNFEVVDQRPSGAPFAAEIDALNQRLTELEKKVEGRDNYLDEKIEKLKAKANGLDDLVARIIDDMGVKNGNMARELDDLRRDVQTIGVVLKHTLDTLASE